MDCLVCNAAVYLPTAKEPRFTADGFEVSVGTNHLGHFLLANLLLEDLKKRKQTAKAAPRLVIVGSITGNDNTVAGASICAFRACGRLVHVRAMASKFHIIAVCRT